MHFWKLARCSLVQGGQCLGKSWDNFGEGRDWCFRRSDYSVSRDHLGTKQRSMCVVWSQVSPFHLVCLSTMNSSFCKLCREPRTEEEGFKRASHWCSQLPPLNSWMLNYCFWKYRLLFLTSSAPRGTGQPGAPPHVRTDESFAGEALGGLDHQTGGRLRLWSLACVVQ